MTYIIRDTHSNLWQQFKARAATEGRALRSVLEALLRYYVRYGVPPDPHESIDSQKGDSHR